MIVVLDTNVWISALEFGGLPDQAVVRALTRDQLAVSGFIRDEITRVLTRKFGRDLAELHALLDDLFLQALLVDVTGEVSGVCRDPNDDAILETAWKSHANLLVAGDKDLLSLGVFEGARILSPAAYLDLG